MQRQRHCIAKRASVRTITVYLVSTVLLPIGCPKCLQLSWALKRGSGPTNNKIKTVVHQKFQIGFWRDVGNNQRFPFTSVKDELGHWDFPPNPQPLKIIPSISLCILFPRWDCTLNLWLRLWVPKLLESTLSERFSCWSWDLGVYGGNQAAAKDWKNLEYLDMGHGDLVAPMLRGWPRQQQLQHKLKSKALV